MMRIYTIDDIIYLHLKLENTLFYHGRHAFDYSYNLSKTVQYAHFWFWGLKLLVQVLWHIHIKLVMDKLKRSCLEVLNFLCGAKALS